MPAKIDQRPVDLHLHSNESDGIFSPEQLVALSAGAGLAAVALTDHDTVTGVKRALRAGERYGIEVVPGVELSAYRSDREVHLLGYYPADRAKLERVLADLRAERYGRMERILDKLRGLGFQLEFAQVAAEAGAAAPGRLHLARTMVKAGLVKNLEQAFTQYLGKGGPAYVPRKVLTPSRAVSVLLDAGAIPVLAHPGTGGEEVLRELIPLGLRGVEVFHPDHTVALRRYYCRRAVEEGLLITGGSDFHGDSKYRARRPGSVTIPYFYLEKLRTDK